MKNDVTKQNYETAHEWHAEKSGGHNWTPQIESFLKLVSTQHPKVLDVGCGAGRDIREFKKRGIDVEGLDYSHSAIESLKKQFPDGKFYEADMRAIGLESDAYDGLWACASILNVEKIEVPGVLKEFNRLLKKGGALFVSVKEGGGERMVPDKAGERFFSFYTETELRTMITDAGFLVDHFEMMNGISTAERWICMYSKKT